MHSNVGAIKFPCRHFCLMEFRHGKKLIRISNLQLTEVPIRESSSFFFSTFDAKNSIRVHKSFRKKRATRGTKIYECWHNFTRCCLFSKWDFNMFSSWHEPISLCMVRTVLARVSLRMAWALCTESFEYSMVFWFYCINNQKMKEHKSHNFHRFFFMVFFIESFIVCSTYEVNWRGCVACSCQLKTVLF